jgi:Domain of unknown function (DUF6487)
MSAEMTKAEKKCSDCGSEMAQGFILDTTHRARFVSRWIKGRPEHSGIAGLVNVAGVECRAIEAWRCTWCGLLKLYATVDVEPYDTFAP